MTVWAMLASSKISTMLEEGASNLSGGQKQRLSIARSLLPNPKVLIFDEASSALDPESEAIVQNNLDKIREDKTMVIVSHRLSTIVGSDMILVFDEGKIVNSGSHKELLNKCEIYKNLWDQQTKHMK